MYTPKHADSIARGSTPQVNYEPFARAIRACGAALSVWCKACPEQHAVSSQHHRRIARPTVDRPSDAGARLRGTPSAWAATAAAAGSATAAAARRSLAQAPWRTMKFRLPPLCSLCMKRTLLEPEDPRRNMAMTFDIHLRHGVARSLCSSSEAHDFPPSHRNRKAQGAPATELYRTYGFRALDLYTKRSCF